MVPTLKEFVKDTIDKHVIDDNLKVALQAIYGRLFDDIELDLSGYYIVLFVPPTLSGLPGYSEVLSRTNIRGIVPLLATEINPPEKQIDTDQVATTSGAIPFATQVTTSNQLSVIYTEGYNIAIYDFHVIWTEYIYQVLMGTIEPSSEYLDPSSDNYGAIDYMGAFYIVKFQPNGHLTYAARAAGVFPLNRPSSDIIGRKAQPQLTTVTVNYSVVDFTEATPESSAIFPEHKQVVDEVLHLMQSLGS